MVRACHAGSSIQHCPCLLLAHVIPPTASTSSWVVGFWEDPDSVGQDSAEQVKGGYAWWPMLRNSILDINSKVSASHKPPVTLEIVILCWKQNSACTAQGCSVTLGQEMPRWDQPQVAYALEGKTSHFLGITPSPFTAITLWMDNSCDMCRTKGMFGSYTELFQNMGLPPLICKRCQVSLNLPLPFQLCVCVEVSAGEDGKQVQHGVVFHPWDVASTFPLRTLANVPADSVLWEQALLPLCFMAALASYLAAARIFITRSCWMEILEMQEGWKRGLLLPACVSFVAIGLGKGS